MTIYVTYNYKSYKAECGGFFNFRAYETQPHCPYDYWFQTSTALFREQAIEDEGPRDNAGMLWCRLGSTCLGWRTSLTFSSLQPSCESVPETQAVALKVCQATRRGDHVPCPTLLYQEINELLPNPRGVHVFSSSCQEGER